MLKLAIVTPPASQRPQIFPFLGPAILKTYLENHGYSVDSIDLAIRIRYLNRFPIREIFKVKIFDDMERVINFLDTGKDDSIQKEVKKIINLGRLLDYDIIGFSIFDGNNLASSLCLAKVLKEQYNKKIVFGGVITRTANYSGLLEFDFIDFLVVGDGEEPLLKIMRYFENGENLDNCDGIFYKKNGILHTSKPSVFPIEMKPIPSFNNRDLAIYKSLSIKKLLPIPYLLEIGCRFKCAFCNEYRNVLFKYTPLEKLVSDVKFLLKTYNADIIYFVEANINNDPDYIRSMANRFIEEGLKFSWGGEGTILGLDEETIKLMAKSGCRFILFGLETASESILNKQNIRKVWNVDQFKETSKLLYRYGIRIHNYLIVEFPFETKEQFKKNVLYIKETAKYITSAECGVFKVVENSPVFLVPKAFNISIREKNTKKYGMLKDIQEEQNYHLFREFDEIDGLKYEDKLRIGLLKEKFLAKIITKHIFLRLVVKSFFSDPLFFVKQKISKPYPNFDIYYI